MSYRIAIVGSGAIGCYYGSRLQVAGNDVHFLMRSDLEKVRADGLHVQFPGGRVELDQPHLYSKSGDIGPVDLVIIALKTTADDHFAELIRPLLGPNTALLTLQNGLGSDDRLAQLFGAERVLGGLCFICVYRTAPGRIECISTGSVSFAEYARPAGERVRAVAKAFSDAGIVTEVGDDLIALRWRKLVWNIPFNGLSIAGGGIATDQILATPQREAEVRGLMQEVVEIAHKLGRKLPDDVIESNIAKTRKMGAYKPSSLIDFQAGREVEVDSIWGEPLRIAREQGVFTPRLEGLYRQIKRQVGMKEKDE